MGREDTNQVYSCMTLNKKTCALIDILVKLSLANNDVDGATMFMEIMIIIRKTTVYRVEGYL